MALQKKLLNCNRNCDGKILKLWRKSTICNGNCDGKLSVTVSFVTNLIVTDPSALWWTIVTETRPSQFFVTEKLWRTFSVTIRLWRKFVTEIVTDFFRHNPFVTENVTEGPSQFSKDELHSGRLFLWRTGELWWNPSQFYDGLVTFRHKLWRNGESPSQFVTEIVMNFRHNSLFVTEFRHKFRRNDLKDPTKNAKYLRHFILRRMQTTKTVVKKCYNDTIINKFI